jgi:hypothetical protein
MTEMIFDTCHRLGGYVWCSVVRTLSSKGGKQFLPRQGPYDTTIILEPFVQNENV